MTDVTTKKPLHVSTDGGAGPYIHLPLSQVDDVRRLLDSHGIRYWVRDNSVSLNDGPFFTIVNLGRGGNADAVQAILDSIS